MKRWTLTDLQLHGLLIWRSELRALLAQCEKPSMMLLIELEAIENDIEQITNETKLPADLADVLKKVGIVL